MKRFAPVAAVIAAAFVVRLAWILLVASKPVGDFAMYLESAIHLVEHHQFDDQFIYMPGYVLLVALVYLLGGGVLAVKVIGAALAALAGGALYSVAASFWNRRIALAAGLAYVLWPAGIAVTSVTGTDMPAAALLAIATWGLVTWGRTRPCLAAVLFGLLMGVGAYFRAVTVPLTAFSFFYFLASGASWRTAVGRAALATGAALLLLFPWAIRNHARYGEWFFTDSHGGLTALVGANPNSEGRYSRSLNRIFKEVTGYTLLEPPHREADRASYRLAKQLTAASPAYAAGLVVRKAERLLDGERALLYWPVYRAGVLAPSARHDWFDRHRTALEWLVDGFWFALVLTFFVGIAVAFAERHFVALSLLPFQAVLAGIYALYFAEVRYHLPIAALMFPLSAAGGSWLCGRVGDVARGGGRGVRRGATAGEMTATRSVSSGRHPDLFWVIAFVGAVAIFIEGIRYFGHQLRQRYQFAAHVCQITGHPALCTWTSQTAGTSPVRGIYDGVGLVLPPTGSTHVPAAVWRVPLPSGRYRIRGQVDLSPLPSTAGRGEVTIRTGGGQLLARHSMDALLRAGRRGDTLPLDDVVVSHAGGNLEVEFRATEFSESNRTIAVWLTAFEVIDTGDRSGREAYDKLQ